MMTILYSIFLQFVCVFCHMKLRISFQNGRKRKKYAQLDEQSIQKVSSFDDNRTLDYLRGIAYNL